MSLEEKCKAINEIVGAYFVLTEVQPAFKPVIYIKTTGPSKIYSLRKKYERYFSKA